MVVFEDVMQLFDFLRSYCFDDEASIVSHPELRVGSARRVGRDRLLLAYGIEILAVLNAETLAQIPEHQRTILLHFKMTRHVFSVAIGEKKMGRKGGDGWFDEGGKAGKGR